ncbi:MAG: hypothetical protein M3Y27_06080, partial [Acidobacteriota bacterium]|nr:hypothetical protein [Acidobacteriota bacterium]
GEGSLPALSLVLRQGTDRFGKGGEERPRPHARAKIGGRHLFALGVVAGPNVPAPMPLAGQ